MSTTQGPKYMYQRLVPKWRALRLNDPEKYGTGPIGLLKNAYGEQPTVCFCMLFGLVGVIRFMFAYKEEVENHTYSNLPYKKHYIVMRPDDVRVKKLKAEWFENGVPPMTKTANIF